MNWTAFVAILILSATIVEWYYAKFKGDEIIEQNKSLPTLPTLPQRNEMDTRTTRKL